MSLIVDQWDPENRASRLRTAWELVALVVCLYFFILGVKLFGAGFKSMGADWAGPLMKGASNPLVGLFIGILATALMQSSSATTSVLVGLVAVGRLDLATAIPVVMGANIGTTATNTFVSIAHITRRGEFRRHAARRGLSFPPAAPSRRPPAACREREPRPASAR